MSIDQHPLHRLTFGAYYPGVLIAGAIVVLFRLSQVELAIGLGQRTLQMGLLCLVFFSTSFARATIGLRYTIPAFLCDVAETLLMFGCFLTLGLLQFDPPAQEPSLGPSCILLIVAVLIQLWWRHTVGVPVEEKHVVPRVIICVTLLALAIYGSIAWVRVPLILVAAGVLLQYVYSVRSEIPKA